MCWPCSCCPVRRHLRQAPQQVGPPDPFIVVGTLVAAVMLIALSFVDNAQLKHLSDVSAIDDPAALEQIYDRQANETLLTPAATSSS